MTVVNSSKVTNELTSIKAHQRLFNRQPWMTDKILDLMANERKHNNRYTALNREVRLEKDLAL